MASIPGQDLQREFLALTRKSQDAMVHAIKIWVETVRTVTPKIPSGYEPLAGKFAKLRTVNAPFGGKLRTPEEALADGYRLAEYLLESQRKLAEDLLKAMVPLFQGGRKSTPAEHKAAPVASATVGVTEHVPVPEAHPAWAAVYNCTTFGLPTVSFTQR